MAAARTPNQVIRGSAGDTTVFYVAMPQLVTGDTWVSGISGIVGWTAVASEAPGTQANGAVAVAQSGGTFTFVPGEDTQTVQLTVWAKC